MSTNTAPSESPVLFVQVPGGEDARRFVDTVRIGRERDNDIVINHDLVSAYHVEITYENDHWSVRDLGSTNGLFCLGERAQRLIVAAPTDIRLGFDGPILKLTPEGASRQRTTLPEDLTESKITERYFSDRPLESMGTHTMMMRAVFKRVQKRRVKKYWIALVALAVLAAGIGGVAFAQSRQIKRQRVAAASLFYAAKSMELEVARLQPVPGELARYNARRTDMRQRYEDFVDQLGIYSDRTPEDIQLVYRVVRRLGESEVNVPREFIDEVLRYVDRWKATNRLQSSLARASENGYAGRIADMLLEEGLPPDFLFLALQESEFKLEAVGPRTRFGFAKGMWQFLPGTARSLGLNTGPLVGLDRFDELDERHDFEKSTRAAARYLYDLYNTDAQASGLLVIASYNWGQGNVLRLIRSLPETPEERNFWNLLTTYRRQIPNETYGYVLSIVSAAVIAENPRLFGFDFEPPLADTEVIAESIE